jgi:hypothetical protein
MEPGSSDQESWELELSLTWKQVEKQGLNIAVATACILHRICAANDAQAHNHSRNAPFEGLEIPDIGVVDNCKRLRRYFNCSHSCFVTALMYIDQILTKTKKASPEDRVVLDTLTIHRLVLVSLVLAVKYHEDSHYSQAYYAQVGGVSLAELNSLERLFVNIVDWDLDVSYDRFVKYFGELVNHPEVCKECQADTISLQPTPTKPPAKTPSPSKAPSSPKPPSVPPPKSVKTPKTQPKETNILTPKNGPKTTFGKWASSVSLSVAAAKASISDRCNTNDSDASISKKKVPKTRREDVPAEKENTTPLDEDEVTGDTSVCERYAELSLSESVGPVRKKSTQHWHDACMPQDIGV